jgi:hypothetical protein
LSLRRVLSQWYGLAAVPTLTTASFSWRVQILTAWETTFLLWSCVFPSADQGWSFPCA